MKATIFPHVMRRTEERYLSHNTSHVAAQVDRGRGFEMTPVSPWNAKTTKTACLSRAPLRIRHVFLCLRRRPKNAPSE